jgi:hypothetical protein
MSGLYEASQESGQTCFAECSPGLDATTTYAGTASRRPSNRDSQDSGGGEQRSMGDGGEEADHVRQWPTYSLPNLYGRLTEE